MPDLGSKQGNGSQSYQSDVKNIGWEMGDKGRKTAKRAHF